MTTESIIRTWNTPSPYCPLKKVYYEHRVVRSGGNSTFVDGRLVLRENNYDADICNTYIGAYTHKRTSNGLFYCGSEPSYTWAGTNVILQSGDPSLNLAAKLLSKWRQSEVNLGVTVGEGRESVEMIINSLNRLRFSWKSLRKGDLGGALRQFKNRIPRSHRRSAQKRLNSKDVSGAFLELHLGWTPLVMDIYNYSDFEVVYKNPRDSFLRVRSSWPTPAQFKSSFYDSNYYEVMLSQSGGVQWKAFLDISKPPSYTERLGLTNPLAVAWELVPFSFVLDWFVPIGTTIEAVHAAKVVPVTTITKSTKKKVDARGRMSYKYLTSPTNFSSDFKLYDRQWSYNKRTVVTRRVGQPMQSGFSLIGTVPKAIRSNPLGSWKRLATSFALFHQVFGK